MTTKEIIEFSNSNSKASDSMKDVVAKLLAANPDLSYVRVNYDEDPDMIKAIIASQPPTISPFFISFTDGKVSKSIAGIVSIEELEDLIK